MKKTYTFTEMSDRRCAQMGCHTKLKRRLVDARKPLNIRYCFTHWIIHEANRDHVIKGLKEMFA